MSTFLFILFGLACLTAVIVAMARKASANPGDVRRLNIFSDGEKAGASLGAAQAALDHAVPTEMDLEDWAMQNTPADLRHPDRSVWQRGFRRGFETAFKASTKKAF